MFSSHLFLVLSCFLGAVSLRTVKGGSGGAQDRHVPHSLLDHYSHDLDEEDTLSRHMFKLYEKCNRENRLREGNTVRSFRATPDSSDQRTVYWLNLTTLQDSEVILSVTFHFLLEQHPPHKPWFCKRSKSPLCHSSAVQPPLSISLLLHSVSSGSEVGSRSTWSLLGNVTFHPHRRGVWQMKDLTQVIKEAWDKGHLLVSVELDTGPQYQRSPAEVRTTGSLPYLLLYADDQALVEPNSVAASLQRYDPSLEGVNPSHSSQHMPNSALLPKGRMRRDTTFFPALIQNNELPDVSYDPDGYRKEDLLERTWYLGLKHKLKPGKKDRKKKNQQGEVKKEGKDEFLREAERTSEPLHFEDSSAAKHGNGRKDERRKNEKKHKGSAAHESPLLNFDEKTMRKARRRQSSETHHRSCSRRNLRVDFADIGWSEWVIAPKAFDAYYCAGTCGFPMPKVARPSNHATIQSIVRAVGIIPGIPEPCCVPEKMNPLTVLYQDEANNPVLKIYPNMSVQSCSCR